MAAGDLRTHGAGKIVDIIERPAHSKNFGARKAGAAVRLIVLHDTGGSADSALGWFANPAAGVSAHYVIARDGRLFRCVPDDKRAYHAGVSECFGYFDVNHWSIGVELEDKSDTDPYPDAQLEALLGLLEDLARRYQIPLNRIVSHADVAMPRGRKVDPGNDLNMVSLLIELGRRLSV